MFCFIHIEKAAGSTLNNLLKYNMPNYVSLYPWYYWSNDTDSILTRKELVILKMFYPVFSGFGGHTVRPYLYYEKVLNGELAYITFFRRPIDRYLSYFYFQNEKMGFERTIDEYLNEPKFNNFMTTRIAGEENIVRAKNIISKNIDFIGLTEEFDKSLLMLNQKIFNNRLDVRYENRNVSDKKIVLNLNDLNCDQRKKVLENNQMDIELYFYAKKYFNEQIVNYNGNLSVEEAQLKESLKHFKYSKVKYNLIKFYKGWNRYIAEPISHKLK